MNARWLSCQTRLFKYAPLEHKKVVKAIVHDIETTSFADEGRLTINYNCFSVHCSLLKVFYLNFQIMLRYMR